MIKEYSFLQDFTSIMKILYQYLKFGGKKLAKSLYAFIKSSIDDIENHSKYTIEIILTEYFFTSSLTKPYLE